MRIYNKFAILYIIEVLVVHCSAYRIFKTIDLKSIFIFIDTNNYSIISYRTSSNNFVTLTGK
nr:MAG TPA_asm: hypothetical protein [Caudoviricetes sp.]